MKTFQILTTTYERITVIADSLTEACKEVREAGYYVAKVYQVAQYIYIGMTLGLYLFYDT